MKGKFTPKFCKFENKKGVRIPVDQYANEAANYLENVQWKQPEQLPETKERANIIMEGLEINDDEFNLEELNYVISKLRNKKTSKWVGNK